MKNNKIEKYIIYILHIIGLLTYIVGVFINEPIMIIISSSFLLLSIIHCYAMGYIVI